MEKNQRPSVFLQTRARWRVRFRLRTQMIAIVLVAVLLGVLRFVLLLGDFFGFKFLYATVIIFTVFFILPVIAIVEVLFLAGYLLFRRKRVSGADDVGPA